MSTRPVIIAASSLLALALVSCMRDDGQASTTTIRSGTAEPSVTNVEPAIRLATELCRHESRCRDSERQRSDEAKLLAEQNCVTAGTDPTADVMGTWSCSPAVARAGYEECLAAIRTERCETKLSSIKDVPRCRSNMVCGRGTE
jgi:hypothetical protein